MKKGLIFIFLCAVVVCVFADSTYSGNDSSSSATMTLGLTAVSGFTSGSTQYGHIVFGFTADGNVTETITPSESITLAESFDSTGGIAVAKGVVFAFVRVASLSNGNGNGSPYQFYSFDPSKDVMADQRIELSIVTSEYDNSSKIGTYESTITMKVTVRS